MSAVGRALARVLALLGLGLSVVACAMTPLASNDSRTTMQITWLQYDDPLALDAACDRALREMGDWRGCAVWLRDRCQISSMEVAGQEDHRNICTLGHETLHCFRGAWH